MKYLLTTLEIIQLAATLTVILGQNFRHYLEDEWNYDQPAVKQWLQDKAVITIIALVIGCLYLWTSLCTMVTEQYGTPRWDFTDTPEPLETVASIDSTIASAQATITETLETLAPYL